MQIFAFEARSIYTSLTQYKMEIRNFSIIAHVDHGKSTLADRFLEICHTVPKDKMMPQLLDSLALERERGITIKLAPVRLSYTLNAINYTLNLIDTPGHVDFSYEVSRALAAVEGAILLVDATQGIQAQTLSHGLSAIDQNLVLIPVINKIDLPSIDINNCKKQLMETFGFREDEILLASGKSGIGIEEILKEVIEKVPAPKMEKEKELRALVFDSFFDQYKGVVAQVKIVEGEVGPISSKIRFLGTKAIGEVIEKGYFSPGLKPSESLSSGEIGYIATGIKEPNKVQVGDTITTESSISTVQLPGYKEVKPMVYVGLYPIDQSDFNLLKDTLGKFRLSDPAFSYAPEHSLALGAGFRCGFLGLLHAEVVQQRLSEEFGMNLLATTPSVQYLVGDSSITSPLELDRSDSIDGLKEPWVKVKIFSPQEFIGKIMDLVSEKRGVFQNQTYFGSQVELLYNMPLSEMITDFYDKLKSVSSGFASLDWDLFEYRDVDAVRVDILVAGEKVDALSTIIIRKKAESMGRRMVEKLKGVLPRQNFEIAIQATIGGKIIARETISPFRKDVTQKLYGGDRTRKDKLLDKQKKGKKKMKMVGRVEIPQEAFLSLLKT